MTKSDMITMLLHALPDTACALERRRHRLQSMSVTRLKRELLMRGLADYDEPEDSGYQDDLGDEPVPAAFLGIVRDPLYTD